MRPLDNEQEGQSIEDRRYDETEYLLRYGRENSKAIKDWVDAHAVVPPPDSPIVSAALPPSKLS